MPEQQEAMLQDFQHEYLDLESRKILRKQKNPR